MFFGEAARAIPANPVPTAPRETFLTNSRLLVFSMLLMIVPSNLQINSNPQSVPDKRERTSLHAKPWIVFPADLQLPWIFSQCHFFRTTDRTFFDRVHKYPPENSAARQPPPKL